jgi:hypothetical protein
MAVAYQNAAVIRLIRILPFSLSLVIMRRTKANYLKLRSVVANEKAVSFGQRIETTGRCVDMDAVSGRGSYRTFTNTDEVPVAVENCMFAPLFSLTGFRSANAGLTSPC